MVRIERSLRKREKDSDTHPRHIRISDMVDASRAMLFLAFILREELAHQSLGSV